MAGKIVPDKNQTKIARKSIPRGTIAIASIFNMKCLFGCIYDRVQIIDSQITKSFIHQQLA